MMCKKEELSSMQSLFKCLMWKRELEKPIWKHRSLTLKSLSITCQCLQTDQYGNIYQTAEIQV